LLALGIIVAACAVVNLISALVMFRRVAKDSNSRHQRVLWTILAVAIGPLVWCVWYCKQRGSGKNAFSELLLADAGDSSTSMHVAHPSFPPPFSTGTVTKISNPSTGVPVARVENFAVIHGRDLALDTSVSSQRGSFGEVFKCMWKGTPVAVKRIMNVADVNKFMQEARMMHSISHPNCVRLYGVCAPPDAAIVMEWMGGGDLLQFLARRPLPKLQRRLSLFRQICAGLNSLHSHSPDPIIHADLKPANILLDSDEKIAKIAELGLSKIKTSSYTGSNAVGTVLYFAPEMLLKGALSYRPTDVYAVGLIFWEMLTGKPVWHNSDGSPFQPSQLAAKYIRSERPPLDELPPGLDPAVIALMQDCWAEDPAQRPTADELWRRMSALDPNNPEHNKPLQLYPEYFAPSCHTLEDCLRLAVPEVFHYFLRDMPAINVKYRDVGTQRGICNLNLSEVEAKCIIMFTLESKNVPDHPRPLDPKRPKRDNQLYFLFNKACRERDAAAVHRFQNFSFHFVSALNKLPNFPLTSGESLYRGFGQRLEEMSDLYRDGSAIWWPYTSSPSLQRETAYKHFARKSGTLMEITRVCNAKDIKALSMIPAEGELLILPNTEFKVKLALSCDQAQALNERYATIPDNVDLVILEAAPARRL
jgi:serine/threonine protein kinase